MVDHELLILCHVRHSFVPQLYVWRPKGSNIAPSDTCDATMLDTQLSILEEADSIRKACLVPLGSVVVNERDQLDDLHERAHTLLTLQTEYLNCTIADWTGQLDDFVNDCMYVLCSQIIPPFSMNSVLNFSFRWSVSFAFPHNPRRYCSGSLFAARIARGSVAGEIILDQRDRSPHPGAQHPCQRWQLPGWCK